MGLLFNRKSNSGEIINRKNIADNAITNHEIHDISKKMHFKKYSTQQEFEKMLKDGQHGGLKREELHENIQQLIAEGKLTKDKGREISRELGLENRFLKYKDYSESLDAQREKETESGSEEKRADFASSRNLNVKHDSSSSQAHGGDVYHNSEPKNVWDILNKQKNG